MEKQTRVSPHSWVATQSTCWHLDRTSPPSSASAYFHLGLRTQTKILLQRPEETHKQHDTTSSGSGAARHGDATFAGPPPAAAALSLDLGPLSHFICYSVTEPGLWVTLATLLYSVGPVRGLTPPQHDGKEPPLPQSPGSSAQLNLSVLFPSLQTSCDF